VAMLATYPFMVVANNDLPAKSIKDVPRSPIEVAILPVGP